MLTDLPIGGVVRAFPLQVPPARKERARVTSGKKWNVSLHLRCHYLLFINITSRVVTKRVRRAARKCEDQTLHKFEHASLKNTSKKQSVVPLFIQKCKLSAFRLINSCGGWFRRETYVKEGWCFSELQIRNKEKNILSRKHNEWNRQLLNQYRFIYYLHTAKCWSHLIQEIARLK